MNERVIRFGTIGVTFVLSIVFMIWYTGGKIQLTSNDTQLRLAEIILTIIASPSIGFILSTFVLWISQRFLEPKLSNEEQDNIQEYLKLLYSQFKEEQSGINYKSKNDVYSISNRDSVYFCHQLLLRNPANEEIISFSSRRMDFYYAHLNTIFTIVLGFIFGFILRVIDYHSFGEFAKIKMSVILPILLYIYFGYKLAKKNLIDSRNFEIRYLLKHYEDKKQTTAVTGS